MTEALIIAGLFIAVGAIAYFATPGRGKPAPKEPHQINLPEWAWVVLALAMWTPIWYIWGVIAFTGLQEIVSRNFAALLNFWGIVVFFAVLPSFWYLFRRRFRTLAWFWMVFITLGRTKMQMGMGTPNRTGFEEPTANPPKETPGTGV